ncbi:hypothetical protein CEP51_002407 [Fusarium floridanum]|uniref:Uncharacterized protein n=1 Tax=Fusarium floridanum TaxID=1325733 RepID=A0A428SBD8_9HYPO|nr:hypothetical protein CEP51_002407 [Fusarium floridanum]
MTIPSPAKGSSGRPSCSPTSTNTALSQISIPPSCHISSPHTILIPLLLRIAFRAPGNIANSAKWQTEHSAMSPR